jgi:hypothetical protein
LISAPAFADDCDEIDKIALKCLNRRLSAVEHGYIGNCNDPSAKEKLIDYIMRNEDFIGRLVLMMRLELLQGTTNQDLLESLQDFDLIMFTQPDNYDWAKMESDRLYKVYHLTGEYQNGSLRFEDLYITFFNNWRFDQQNMGLDNFINATFSYAIGRSPTKAEYKYAKRMLVEEESFLFYQKGSSKLDYLRILTSNDNFWEKQVKYWHYYFLYEYPDNKEIYRILREINLKNKNITIIEIIRYLITNKIK